MAASSPQKSRKRDGRNVSLTRFIVLVPAIGMMLGAITLTVVGAIEVFNTTVMAFGGTPRPKST